MSATTVAAATDSVPDVPRPPRGAYLLPLELRVSLLTIVLVLIVVGVLPWLVNTYVPMDAKIKSILNAVVVIGVIIWLLQAFGLLDALKSIDVG